MSLESDNETLGPPFRTELLDSIPGSSSHHPVIPLLPTTYRHRHQICLVRDSISFFLEAEFDLERLNKVHHWLWICGLPSAPRSLHHQLLKDREIAISELLDLHLVWSPRRIFIKPLPRFLLSSQFWREYICPTPDLYRTALGFLRSYVALVEREIDYRIAIEKNLLPMEVTWTGWLAFSQEVLLAAIKSDMTAKSSVSISEPRAFVNPRFYYGELRLGRLNWIYRIILGKPRGYLSGCTTYGAFVRDNFNSLITLFAYITIVLSAMQVGLSTQWLADDYGFGMASYVFSIFSIVAPLLAVVIIVMVLGVIFTQNLLRTLRIRKKRRKEGAGM